MNIFEKVSFEQFLKDCRNSSEITIAQASEEDIRWAYDNIKLPTNATKCSAGLDFYYPFKDILHIGKIPKVFPTGVRWIGDDNMVLLIVPRSSLGFKYQLKLLNTVGVIDADYCCSDNEGHIQLGLVAENDCYISTNDRVVQGITVNFCKLDNASNAPTRNGGFGSTSR